MTIALFADSVATQIILVMCLVGVISLGVLLVTEQKKRTTNAPRQSRLESLECRWPLDTQVGTVSMPYTGTLSAGVYDSNGVLVRTLLAGSEQTAGNVSLMWDGKDNLGRTVMQDGNYTWRALASQVQAVDEGGVGDSEFTTSSSFAWGDFDQMDASDQQTAIAVDGPANGVTSQTGAGGTFARTQTDTYFGDTTLSQSYTLSNTITASGQFSLNDTTLGWSGTGDSGFFIGHFSTNSTNRDFIGFMITEGDSGLGGLARLEARFQDPTGSGNSSALVPLTLNTVHNFSYSYNPSGNGQLTVTIDSLPAFVVNLTAGEKASGATFNSFGMGITSNLNSENASTKTVQAFIDDVSYSGNTGVENFTANPSWTGSNNTANGNNIGWGSYTRREGGLYEVSVFEEGHKIRKISHDGRPIWALPWGNNAGVTSDGTYVYVTSRQGNEDRINRYRASDGGAAPFTQVPGGFIIVNNDAYNPRPAGQGDYTTEQRRAQYSTWGVTSDGSRVWVSNYRNNRVEVYDRTTGLKLGQFTVTKPVGLAFDTATGAVWVANNGNRVTRFTFNGSYVFTEGTSITGLNGPSGLSIRASNRHLFVGETAGTIREYDITSTPTLAGLQVFGSNHQSGPIGPSTFHFKAWASVAVSADGILNVLDDARIQRFYTESNPAAGITAGDLYDSMHGGPFVPVPTDTYGYTADGKYFLVNDNFDYEVDSNYTGGPRPGWYGDGSWRLVARYNYDALTGATWDGGSWQRTLTDGATPRDFRFSATGSSGGNMILWAIEPTGVRMAAMIGKTWIGANLLDTPRPGQYIWTDNDGDGQIDWNGIGSGVDGEVVWTTPLGTEGPVNGTPFVDDAGNILMAGGAGGYKLSLSGFTTTTDGSGHRNPTYNWDNVELVLPNVNDDVDLLANATILGADGSIYTGGLVNTGVGVAAYYDSNGNRKAFWQSPDDIYRAAVIDETDATPDYLYTGHADGAVHWVHMWTNDGLLVTTARPGAATGNIAGWIDTPYGLGVFTHPHTGKTYIYAEDVWYGKAERYRIDNLQSIQRQTATFSWTASHPATGTWTFDNVLTDSVGSNHGTYIGGTASYATGKISNAINMAAANQDYVNILYANDPSAYAIMAWVKPTDTTSVNVFSRTNASGSGGVNSHQLRIDANGKFQHALLSGGSSAGSVVVGTTTVQPNTWYHVAIVAAGGGKARLYVNGQEEGVAADVSFLWLDGDRFQVGNAAAGGFGYYDGLIDDLRIYHDPLLASDIQAIAGTAVYVHATDPLAAETGGTGTFTISRTGSTTSSLVVNYAMSGTATNNSDYSTLAGSVTIASGQTSATVTVTPINDAVNDPSETVILTISSSANYLNGSPASATIVIADNEATGDPAWLGSNNNNVNGNNFGWSYNTSHAGGSAGEIGGTFSRYRQDAFYGDVNLTSTFNLSNTITASGKFDMPSITAGWGGSGSSGVLIGHFSELAERKDFIGIYLFEDTTGTMRVRARVQGSDGSGWDSGVATVAINGNHTFSYTYDPSLDAFGRLTLNIDALPALVVELTDGAIASGATFDSFGIGYTSNVNSEDASAKTAQVFIDDLSYSGSQTTLPTVSVSATDADAAEPVNPGVFTISRDGNAGTLTVNYAITGTATNNSDYSTLSGSVVIPDGQSSVGVTVNPIDDSSVESNETVILTISTNAAYTVGSPNSGTVTIVDNDTPSVTVLATDNSATETAGNNGTFTVTRTGSTTGSLVVNYSMSGTATNNSDYSTLSGAVTIASGQASATITVTPIDDSSAEGDETAILTLTSGSGYNVGAPNGATVTITDNEPTVTITAGDASAAEASANTGTFVFTRTNTTGNLVVNFSKTGSATNGTDYSSIAGSVTITSGNSTATVTVTPIDDSTVETNETVVFTLTSGSYFVGSPDNSTVTIADNDSSGVVDFTSNPNWTGSGNTTGGNNYGYSSGTSNAGGGTGEVGGTFARNVAESYYADTNLTSSFTFANTISGSGKLTFFNQVNTDGGWFLGHLSSSTSDRAMVGIEFLEQSSTQVRFRAKANEGGGSDVTSSTIIAPNGDYNYEYTYNPALGTYGRITVRLYNGSFDQTTSVDLNSAVRNGTATFNGFGIGINANVAGDNNASKTIQFFIDDVNYSGQQGLPTLTVTAGDAAASEQGPDTGTFVVTRNNTAGNLTVNYTLTGTATNNSDYSTLSGVVTISSGQSTATVTVTPIDDITVEPGETVILTLGTSAGYLIGSPNSATVTIADNEPTVTISAADANAAEASADPGVFTITRSNTNGSLVVNYTTSGSATSGSDYSALAGSVTIASGATSANVTITPIDDATVDPSETVILNLSSSTSYIVGTPANATATIADNDTYTVTVTASDASAAEAAADVGKFTVTRAGGTSGNLVVNYTLTGTATSGSDYSALAGSVTIASGQSTATITVTPIDDTTIENSETVILTISTNANYTVGSPNNATVTIADNDAANGTFSTDPGWTGVNNISATLGNNYAYSAGTSHAGGSTGEVGGTFARAQVDSFYGDTNLASSFNLNNTITASGKFDIPSISSGWYSSGDSGFFLGHFSQDPNSKEFIGLEFKEHTASLMRVRARYQLPSGSGGADSPFIYVSVNGNHTFSYSYDPTLGTSGRLTVNIDAQPALVVDLSSTERASGALFNGFGIGATSNLNSQTDSTKTAQLFIDDVLYSGGQVTSLPTVSISATDSSASEPGANTGAFTITRTNTSGDLSVIYTVTGTATNGADYSTLASSVIIPNGQTTATITVTPINDTGIESSETVILTLQASSGNYNVGTPGNATVNIADDDTVNAAFSTNPSWTGSGNTTSGNNYTWSNTSNAAGGTGEIGGTFARNSGESYYADTTIAPLALGNTITASGKLTAFGQVNTDGSWMVGHLSSSTSDQSMVGIEFLEQDSTSVRFRAKVGGPAGDSLSSTIIAPNGDYNFEYAYNPAANGGLGAVTARLFNGTFDQTTSVNLTSTVRNGGSTFNAFGIGIASLVAGSNDSARTVQFFVDDVNYSGFAYAQDGFESGNGSGGTGWAAAWTLAGAASVVNTGTPATGSYHLQLTSNTGSATRAVNLSGVTTARLVFDWKANSFEAGETAVVEINDGTNWITVQTISDGQDDNVYHHSDINLSGYTLGSNFQVRIRSLMSAADDFLYIDNLKIAR